MSRSRAIGRRATRLHDSGGLAELPQKPSTKALVLDTAELLFARYGLEGTSLREIALAAGQSNPNVVKYYFDDKPGLIKAILRDRLKQMDLLRGEFLKEMAQADYKDPRKVLKSLWMPWVMIKSSNGSHSFCQFYLYYIMHSGIARHPIFENLATSMDLCRTTKKAEKEFPNTVALMAMLRKNFEAMPSEVFARRVVQLGMMYFTSISQHDYECLHPDAEKIVEFDIEPILDMALPALRAPY